MKMTDEALKARWVEALRSGKYHQGTGRLRCQVPGQADRFCCLGVLCELLVEDGRLVVLPEGSTDQVRATATVWYTVPDWEERAEVNGFDDHRDDAVVPVRVANELGLEQGPLWEMNDRRGLSFPEIADWIEENL